MTPQQFKDIRAALGYSTKQMADALGVTRRTIQHYESGRRSISKTVENCLSYIRNTPITENK